VDVCAFCPRPAPGNWALTAQAGDGTWRREVLLILANLRPEWAGGLYHLIRSHYLQAHPEEDPIDWEEQAEQTVRAIPVAISLGRDRAMIRSFANGRPYRPDRPHVGKTVKRG